MELDDFLDNLSRRELLGGITGLGTLSGVFYFISLDISEEIREVEQELQQLTQSLYDDDLADPRSADMHLQNIQDTVQTTEAFVDSESTGRALDHESRKREWQSRLSILPGVDEPSSKPPLQSRINVIENATELFRSLERGLEVSLTIRRQVRDSEIETLYRDQSKETVSIEYASTERFEEQIRTIESHDYGEISHPHRSDDLAPDSEQLVTDLDKQSRIYTAHISGQQAVLRTSQNIVEGVTERENNESTTARESFEVAQEHAKIDVDSDLSAYSISRLGPTGAEYIETLDEYRSAVRQFTASIDTSGKESQAQFWEGYDLLLNARENLLSE